MAVEAHQLSLALAVQPQQEGNLATKIPGKAGTVYVFAHTVIANDSLNTFYITLLQSKYSIYK